MTTISSEAGMDEAPISQKEAKNLRFLRILVTVLTATMILGLLTIVGLLVMRFTADTAAVPLPAGIALPDGTKATAFTRGADWYAVVTDGDEILIYDMASGALKQRIEISE